MRTIFTLEFTHYILLPSKDLYNAFNTEEVTSFQISRLSYSNGRTKSHIKPLVNTSKIMAYPLYDIIRNAVKDYAKQNGIKTTFSKLKMDFEDFAHL